MIWNQKSLYIYLFVYKPKTNNNNNKKTNNNNNKKNKNNNNKRFKIVSFPFWFVNACSVVVMFFAKVRLDLFKHFGNKKINLFSEIKNWRVKFIFGTIITISYKVIFCSCCRINNNAIITFILTLLTQSLIVSGIVWILF